MSTHDLGIVYENEVAQVRELETERKPYGCSSEFIVMHKTMPSVKKVFSERDGRDAQQKAINWCDSYVRQVVE